MVHATWEYTNGSEFRANHISFEITGDSCNMIRHTSQRRLKAMVMLRQQSDSGPINIWNPRAKGRKTPTESHWSSKLRVGRKASGPAPLKVF